MGEPLLSFLLAVRVEWHGLRLSTFAVYENQRGQSDKSVGIWKTFSLAEQRKAMLSHTKRPFLHLLRPINKLAFYFFSFVPAIELLWNFMVCIGLSRNMQGQVFYNQFELNSRRNLKSCLNAETAMPSVSWNGTEAPIWQCLLRMSWTEERSCLERETGWVKHHRPRDFREIRCPEDLSVGDAQHKRQGREKNQPIQWKKKESVLRLKGT